MKTTNHELSDEKDLEEIADFVGRYLKQAETVFFVGHKSDALNEGIINQTPIDKNAFKKGLDQWLDGEIRDNDNQLVKALAENLKKSSSAEKIYASFNATHNLIVKEAYRDEYHHDHGTISQEKLQSFISKNEYVKQGKDLSDASFDYRTLPEVSQKYGANKISNKRFNVINVCRSIGKLCLHWDMPKTANFFLKKANYHAETQTRKKTDKMLGKISSEGLESLEAIRARASSRSISQGPPIEMTAVKRSNNRQR